MNIAAQNTMKHIRLLLTTVCALLLPLCMAKAQQIRTFPNYQQLPGPVVRQVLQDEEGYMWYSTTDCGICRDNGYQTDIFNGQPEQGYTRYDRFVLSMGLGKQNQILYGTKSGAWILDKQTYKVVPFASKIINKTPISSIVTANDGTYWLTSGSIVYHIDDKQELIKMYVLSHQGKTVNKITLHEDSKHRIWALLQQGAPHIYNGEKECFEACKWDLQWSPFALVEDSINNCYWISTNGGGIIKYSLTEQSSPTQGTITEYPVTRYNKKEDNHHRGFIYGLSLDGGSLWAVTSDNLYRYRITPEGDLEAEDISSLVSPSQKAIESVYVDEKNNLWVSSFTPKPFVITPEDANLRKYPIPQIEKMMKYPLIADHLESEEQCFWLIQSRLGLVHYDYETDKLTIANDQRGNRPLKAYGFLIKQRNGKGVWTIINRNIHAIWKSENIIKTELITNALKDINCLYETKDGYLLLGTENNITQINPKTKECTLLADSTGSVNDIRQANDGTIYFVSQTMGLGCIASNSVRSLNKDYAFDHLALTDSGTIYVASSDGIVAKYDTERNELYPDPIASDNRGCIIKKLKVAENGHLWILTSLYIKDYNPQTKSFRFFNSTDAIFNIDYFQDIKLHKDKAYFSGAGCIYSTQLSSSFTKADNNTRIAVTNIGIDGKRTCLPFGTKSIDVDSDTEQLVVYLSTFNHLNAEKTAFSYKIKDEMNWEYLPTGMNTLFLSGLQKGKHTLLIRATNEYGLWSDAIKVLTIHRLPAWWETWWAYLIYISLAAVLMLLLIRLLYKKTKEKQQEEMEHKLTEMKFKFFTNISHELRTPLTLIITPLSSILKSIPENELKNKLEGIQTAAEKMLQLVNNLLAFRKLELKETKLQLRYGELSEFVRQASESFKPICEKKELALTFESEEKSINCYFDKNLIQHIVFNLLSNAQKFTPKGGQISVKVRRKDAEWAIISVADTGIGIPLEQQERIFERFYQVGVKEQEGSGIGLNIVSEFANIHKGQVKVESTPGKGSTFSVFIPLNLSKNESPSDQQHETIIPEEKEKTADETKENSRESSHTSNSKLTVLLIEDNADLLHFIANELAERYNVLTLPDANQYTTILLQRQVDIVVSDIMMPGINGLELCRNMKSDENTSHIPIILLTAMAEQENELEGYQNGADFYLTKPFDIDILKSHLKIIEQRLKERKHALLNSENPDIDTLYTSELDRRFMKQLQEMFEQNVSNPEYDIEQLSSDLCMSRVTMYRKVKTLTGQSPLELMRMFRLKRAEQLLRSTNLSITEISERVGFSSQSYFSRIFSKHTGKLPSEYRKERTNDA